MLLVNGRLTESSLPQLQAAPGRCGARCSARLDGSCVQDQAYADRFVALGAPPDRVRVTGTMKFDTAAGRRRASTAPTTRRSGRPARRRRSRSGSAARPARARKQIVLAVYRDLLDEAPAPAARDRPAPPGAVRRGRRADRVATSFPRRPPVAIRNPNLRSELAIRRHPRRHDGRAAQVLQPRRRRLRRPHARRPRPAAARQRHDRAGGARPSRSIVGPVHRQLRRGDERASAPPTRCASRTTRSRWPPRWRNCSPTPGPPSRWAAGPRRSCRSSTARQSATRR